MRQALFAFIAVVILLGFAIAGFSLAYGDAVRSTGDATDVQNETFTIDQGTPVGVNVSNVSEERYSETAAVYYNNTTVERDGNYTWDAGDGEITALNGSYLTDGDTANISYTHYTPAPAQKVTISVAGLMSSISGYPLTVLLFFLFAIGGFAYLGRAA